MPERSFAGSREKIGIFTILSYARAKVRNNLMKVCLVVNSLYIVAGILMICMSTALRELL